MKISSVSRFELTYGNPGQEGRGGQGRSPDSSFAGLSFPVDTVHLSSAAQAHLSALDEASDGADSDHAPGDGSLI